MAKIELKRLSPVPPAVININVQYCCARVLLYAKMLKEIETEETIDFFVTFLSLVSFQLEGWGRALCPLLPGDPYALWHLLLQMRNNHCLSTFL